MRQLFIVCVVRPYRFDRAVLFFFTLFVCYSNNYVYLHTQTRTR